jgi:hypothetical protein
MATLYITEVARLGYDAKGEPVLAPEMPAVNEQALEIGVESAVSRACDQYRRLDRCCAGRTLI